MAVQIEILGISERNVRVAFYYPVPGGSQIPDAVGKGPDPAGTRLSSQEIQDLKDGKIFELLRTVNVPDNLSGSEARALLISNRSDMQSLAVNEYKRKYTGLALIGQAYDGVSWS